MNLTKHRPHTVWLIVLVMMLVASLACGPFGDGGDDDEEPTEEPEEVEEEEPAEEPEEPEPEPKKPTLTPMPEAAGLTADAVADLQVLRAGDISESALLVAAASPDSTEFATYGFDKFIRIWDSETGDLLREMRTGEFGYGLVYSPDGTMLAASAGFHVVIWDPATGDMLQDIIINAAVFRVVWSPDSEFVAAVGAGSSRIEIIQANNGQIVETFKNPTGYVLWAVAYSPDGSLLATADFEGRLSVIESDTGTIVFENLTGGRGATWDLEFSPDGNLLASCNAGGGVYIWETTDWGVVLSGDDLFEGGCTDGDFSETSDVYFGVGHDGWLSAWDMGSGDMLAHLDFSVVIWAVSVAGNNEFLVIAVDDGSAYVLGLP